MCAIVHRISNIATDSWISSSFKAINSKIYTNKLKHYLCASTRSSEPSAIVNAMRRGWLPQNILPQYSSKIFWLEGQMASSEV